MLTFFQASVTIQVGDGEKTHFWIDKWLLGQSISDLALAVVSAVSSRIIKKRTVAQAMHNRQWVVDITGPITVQVITEFIYLRSRIDQVALEERADKFNWKWMADGNYSAQSAYQILHKGKT